MKTIIVLCLCLTACNQGLAIKPIYRVPAEVEPLVASFAALGAERGWVRPIDNLVVELAVLGYTPIGKALGDCDMNSEPPLIRLDWNDWRVMSLVSREEVLFHELGHCLLRRGHDTRVQYDIPLSIMYPSIIDANTYTSHRSEYLDELFADAPHVVILQGLVQ